MKVLIGTGNPGKLREIQGILGDITGIAWLTPHEIQLPEVAEQGATFEANAVAKAGALARLTGYPTLAEDSGLEVDALGRAPGVRSARFAGEDKDPAANNRRLLLLLAGTSDRRARFRTVAALALPDGRVWTVEGVLEGRIAEAPRGSGGFGYDPLFIPEGETRTLAEMSPEEKNRISHRRQALEGLRPILLAVSRNPSSVTSDVGTDPGYGSPG
ncbi:RdgB/HAM1 family non-canonical purine NTP pyrophosphatase [Candidatus Bipolaricaulota bacterium]|nr:RdgB/HAM1 family non-canonical purine NTP pyrophosphatase [Candidatus Bipolaricaulota bacterium]